MGNGKVILITLVSLISISAARTIASESEESFETNQLGGYLDEIQSSCLLKTGSNDTFETMSGYMVLTPICIATKLDVESFSDDLDNLTALNRVEFFTKYCPQMHDALSCLDPFLDEFRKCLDDEEKQLVDIIVNLLPEAVNLVCKDHGQIFFIQDEDFKNCSANFMMYAEKCTEKISNATEAMDVSKYGSKQCGEISDMRQCFKTQLDECKAPRLLDLFDLFYRSVVKSTPCKDYIILDELPTTDDNEV